MKWIKAEPIELLAVGRIGLFDGVWKILTLKNRGITHNIRISVSHEERKVRMTTFKSATLM